VALAFLAILSGIQMLTSSLWFFGISANADKPSVSDALSRLSPWVAERATGVFFLLAIVLLVLAVSSLLLARGYYRGYDRARVRGRYISGFAIAWAVLGILILPERADPGSPWWTIPFNAVILVYLGSQGVRAYFRP